MKIYVLFLVCFTTFSCTTQTDSFEKQEIISEEQMFSAVNVEEEPDFECKEKSQKIRVIDQFPFSEMDSVELVLFDPQTYENGHTTKMTDGECFVPEEVKRKTLSEREIKSLFDILYNQVKVKETGENVVSDCYNPHHTLIFYNQGKPFTFLEICIKCQSYKSFRKKPVHFPKCDQKWSDLHSFFESINFVNHPQRENH